MSFLRKSVTHTENGSVTFRLRETYDKVQGDVRPRVLREWERMQQTSGRVVRGLMLGTGRAGEHIFSYLSVHCWPPKELLDDILGPLDPRVAGKVIGMKPVNDL